MTSKIFYLSQISGVFLLCWIPFFTCNILTAVALKTDLDYLMPTMTLFLLTTWLGYVNSAMNPVIYTLFNHEFRSEERNSVALTFFAKKY